MRTTIGVANFGGYNAATHIDFPSIGNIAFKLDAAIQHQDATTRNPMPGQTGWNYFDRQGLRLSARWEPSSHFSATLAGDIGRDSNSPFYSQLLNYNPLGRPIGPASGTLPSGSIRPLPPIVVVSSDRMRVADLGVPQQPSVDDTGGVSLHLNWNVAPWLELRSISAYRQVEVSQWDNSGGAHRIPAFTANGNFSRYSLANLWQHQYSQEVQAVGSLPEVDFTAGLFYFYERAEDDAATPSTLRWNADGTGYTVLDPTPTFPGSRALDRASVAFARSFAAYGQATWTPAMLGDIVHLTLGGRYTHDDKNGRLFIVNNAATAFTFDQQNDRFDPMATIAVDPVENVEIYARYATGYRAGGASSRSLTYRSFGPEEVQSYEIGVKSDLLDRRLRLNVAAYMMDRTGSQIDFNLVTPQPSGSTRNTLETINAPGTTKIRGIEVEATARLTEQLTVSAAYAYTYTRIPPTLNPFTNQIQPVFIVFTPRNAASAAIDYTVPVFGGGAVLRAHLDANYADATQTFDISPVKNDRSFIVNGRLGLGEINLGEGATTMSVALWSRNLLNADYVYRRDPANRATLGDYGNLNAPRTFGLEASFRF
jgi:iron complex outermembrane receptor protein